MSSIKKHGLLKENLVYKPFRYPWCYDAWLNPTKDSLVTGRGPNVRRRSRLGSKT